MLLFCVQCVLIPVLSESYTLLDGPKSSSETQATKSQAKQASQKIIPAKTSSSKRKANMSKSPAPVSKKTNSKHERKMVGQKR